MSVKKRHPVLWPRMKIRGRRRKALVAERRVFVTVIPFARVVMQDDGTVTAWALAAPEPGAMRIESRRCTDGFGRPVTGAAS